MTVDGDKMNKSLAITIVLTAVALPWAAQPQALPAGVGVGALARVDPASRVRKLTHPGGLSVTRLGRVLVAEGERVAAGQVLAELADVGQKDAAVAQAAATLTATQQTLAKVIAGGRESEVMSLRAHIGALQAAEESAKRDASRAERLVPSGAGPVQTAEQLRFAATRLMQDRIEAQGQLQTLLGPRAEDLAIAQAQVAQSEAALANARENALLSRIIAPVAGTVLKINAWPGTVIGPDGVMDIGDTDHLDAVADVYETDVVRLREGAAAEVIVPGDATRYPATVREIGRLVRRNTQAGTDPVLATDARTVEVRLSLGDAGRHALEKRIGMQVQVAIKP